MKIMVHEEFTWLEMMTISEALITLINNATEAEKLLCDDGCTSAINEYQFRLKNLNDKIIRIIEDRSRRRNDD